MIHRILNHKSASIASAAFILGAASLASRILGLFRDRLLAGGFGAGQELDIYYAAFRLPDLVYNIFIVGAIAAAFIPLFAEYFQKKENEGWRYANNILNFTVLGLVIMSVILILFAAPIVKIIAPGFDNISLDITATMTRIMFLSPLLLGISAVVSGMLHYFSRFFVYSLAPIFYNLGIIFGIIFLVPRFGIYGLAWGVVLGAFLHLLIQIPILGKLGFKWRLKFSFDKGVIKTFTLMVPRTVALASNQINLWVITALASLLAAGSIAIFNLANNLQHLPIGIIGIAFATAAFPTLAATSLNNKEEFSKKLASSFKLIFFLTFPLGIIFYLLRAQIVRVVLGTGEFGWVDTRLTAAVLGVFALSVFAQSLIPLLVRAFFALKDTLTPTVITIIFVLVNISLAYFFIGQLGTSTAFGEFLGKILRINDIKDISVIALPLAFSIASFIHFLLLIIFLNRKSQALIGRSIGNTALRSVLAAVLASPIGYLLLYGMANFLPTETGPGIFVQGFVAGVVVGALYIFLSMLFKSEEVWILVDALRDKFRGRLPKDMIEEDGNL
jgi:putative peptidoglycan lipid II flippase